MEEAIKLYEKNPLPQMVKAITINVDFKLNSSELKRENQMENSSWLLLLFQKLLSIIVIFF